MVSESTLIESRCSCSSLDTDAETAMLKISKMLLTKHPKTYDIISEQYKVIEKLGEGGFGVVYKVQEINSHQFYALKMEIEKPLGDDIGTELEAVVVKRGQGLEHFLRFVDQGSHGPFGFVVMQLAGPTLSQLQRRCRRRRFSNDTSTRIAVQCLAAVHNVHIIGFVHRDIKPGNFLMGADHTSDCNRVYITDFGLVRRFRLKDGSVRPRRRSAGFRGSYEYASVTAHLYHDLGRRDDMWSLLYSIIKMRVGRLPWHRLSDEDEICRAKRSAKRDVLLERMEPEYGPMLDSLERLHYADQPDYDLWRRQLCRIWRRRGYTTGAPFDWQRCPASGGDFAPPTSSTSAPDTPRPSGEAYTSSSDSD